MDKSVVKQALVELNKNSPKRNFIQSYDLIINLKNIDLKKPEQQVDLFIQLSHPTGNPKKICALVGGESVEDSEGADKVIISDNFSEYKDKQKAKKLAEDYDFFIAQANLMGQIAGTFGRVFGPRNKMPNPKSGCIVSPKTTLGPVIERLNKTVRLIAKKSPTIQLKVGMENMDEKQVIENIISVYEQLIHHLPSEKNNIKSVLIKKTMSKPIKVA